MKMKSMTTVGIGLAIVCGSGALAACTASAFGVDVVPAALRWRAKEFWRMNVRPLVTWPKNEIDDKADRERHERIRRFEESQGK